MVRKIDIYCRNIFKFVCNAERRAVGSAVIGRQPNGEEQSSDFRACRVSVRICTSHQTLLGRLYAGWIKCVECSVHVDVEKRMTNNRKTEGK